MAFFLWGEGRGYCILPSPLTCLSWSSSIRCSPSLAASCGCPKAFVLHYRLPQKAFGWHFSCFWGSVCRKGEADLPDRVRSSWGKEIIRSQVAFLSSCYSRLCSCCWASGPSWLLLPKAHRPAGNSNSITDIHELCAFFTL